MKRRQFLTGASMAAGAFVASSAADPLAHGHAMAEGHAGPWCQW